MRETRPPQYASENEALVALAQELAASPDRILQKLVDTALVLCRAHSAGISLFDDERKSFYWPVLAGAWAPQHVGGGTPANFGPCGTVCDLDAALLFARPERDFPYLSEATRPVDEALLVPFHLDGEPVGTIWVVAHDESRRFDAEDLRLLTSLATFSAAAYQSVLALTATELARHERAESVEELRRKEARLAVELASAKRLHEISTELIDENSAAALYEKILDAAVALTRSDMASMQMLDAGRGALRLLAWRGFDPIAAAFWEWVDARDGSSCANALAKGERVIVQDSEACAFMAGTPDLEQYRRLGLRSVQSTPLVSRSGRILGMISTHWRVPHEPQEHELRSLDVLARQAADLIERNLRDEERARTEEILRVSEARLQALFDHTPLGAYLVDADFRIRTVNPVARPVFGDIPGLIGRDFEEVVHILWPSDSADELVRRFRHTLQTGETYATGEASEQRRDRGVTESYEWRINRIPLPDGRYGVVCWFRDISAQIAAREAVAHSEERYRTLVEVITDIPWTTDAEGEFVTPQPAWETYTGQRLEEMRGGGWANALHPDDRENCRQLWQQARESRSLYEAAGRIWHAPSGQYRYFEARATPLLRPDGSVREWVGTCTDVHERKRAEVRLREADRMKDEFLATLSHELRSPLTSIVGWAHMLSAATLSEDEIEVGLSTIRSSATAQTQLIDDLLDISRITTGKMRLDRQGANLAAVVHAAMDGSRPAAEAKNITVTASLDHTLADVFVDASRIQQVVWNLLSNAIKFSPPGSSVAVALRREGPSAVIEVRDDGPGIPRGFLPHMFERFRQADSSAQRGKTGLGIGLALVKELTELHGGTIEVESEEGSGARFTVRLPIVEARPDRR
ncbi:MAG TPA: ATP-binding protein [Thermoanaerobaculia bacterium]